MRSPAAILLAFANDWVDNKRHLRSLLDESKAIDKALASLVESGALAVPSPLHNATVDDVIGVFRERRYRDRIRIFHFGGHASGSMLLFEDEAGKPTCAHAGGLAGYLGRQRGLVLVVLNGCCTEPQVRRLREAGIKAVVATTRATQDAVAAEFAKTFYAELAARPLRDAFDTAVQAIRLRWGDDPRSVTRDVATPDEAGPPGWPWILDCDASYEDWTLASELARQSRRAWRVQLLLAVAATSMLLATSLALSAGARRTACRAPGLRSLCAAIGIGEVPTPDEQALWDEARRLRAGDGLRAYLRSYPAGAYADEARSRLAGCTIERIETPGPDVEHRYRWRVNPSLARLFPTKDEARRDALARGKEDAKAHCASLGMKDRLLSAVVDPHVWDCNEYDHRFACGFDGDLVCHVQERSAIDHERCRDEDK